MEWISDNPGERFTTTRGRYQAVVWQTKTGHWGASIKRDGAAVAQDTFNTVEFAWAWCEAQLAALAAAEQRTDD